MYWSLKTNRSSDLEAEAEPGCFAHSAAQRRLGEPLAVLLAADPQSPHKLGPFVLQPVVVWSLD